MFFVLIAAIIGALFAFLSTQNTIAVPVHIASYTWSHVPLYLVAIASLLVGLFVSWLLSLVNWASSSLSLHGKESRARSAEVHGQKLEKRIAELEEENTKLAAKMQERKIEDKITNPSPIDKLTRSITR